MIEYEIFIKDDFEILYIFVFFSMIHLLADEHLSDEHFSLISICSLMRRSLMSSLMSNCSLMSYLADDLISEQLSLIALFDLDRILSIFDEFVTRNNVMST
jgi:hypothetical protein